jgi:hypothetical protein
VGAAIANSRFVAISRDGQRHQIIRLASDEFVRRFLLRVFPDHPAEPNAHARDATHDPTFPCSDCSQHTRRIAVVLPIRPPPFRSDAS